MSLCTPCTKTKDINICTDELIIGTVTPSTDYNVYFRSLANGFIVKYELTSDSYGTLSIDTSTDELLVACNIGYELFINQTTSYNTGEDFIIGTTTVNCLNVQFIRAGSTVTSQTIELI